MNLKRIETKVLLVISPAILFIFLFLVYNYNMHSEGPRKLPAPANRHHYPTNLDSVDGSAPAEQSTAQDAAQNLPPSKDGVSDVGSEERTSLLAGLWWPLDNKTLTSVTEATDATKCFYKVIDLRENYTVGSVVRVVLVARDGNGRPKTHGGDFFQAKLHNSGLKASTFGPVVDHLNGTYTVQFSLLWPGPARVSVRLIHSSEAVQVIRRQRQQDPDKVYFFGHFVDGSRTEQVPCNAQRSPWLVGNGTGGCCQYTDPVTRESWFCRRPASLPCWTLTYHSMGSYRAKLSSLDASVLHGSRTNIMVPGRDFEIHVLPQDEKMRETRPQCRPGLGTAVPAGFYFQDRWTSLQCRSRSFPTPALLSACLRDKEVHMMGDSTLRQWFEYLESAVPTLKRLNVHTSPMSGPLHAIDPQNNTVLHWRAHGLPIRTHKTPVADLHYIGRELESMAGGEHTVVVFTIWAHFTTHPLDNYIRRLATIRRAVRSLLQRAPRTLVAIKTANTGYKDVYGSDWLSWQLDLILRAMFRNLPVVFIDAWQMTSCHYSPDNIHPPRPVVMNEVDLLLSFVCPQ
ncbi:NXPE family member 3-like [Anguilla rostrata]|uniref:NXPE family member 3-like n=1 Tax=Anguilla rostrata TaxID=7938 RepID=UPI0030D0E260